MLKRRVAAVEKRIAGLGGTAEKMPRLVFRFGDGANPLSVKSEAQVREKGAPPVFIMPRPEMAEGDRVLRFDFGDGGQARQLNEKANDVAEGEETQK